MVRTIIQELSSLISARQNCIKRDNADWFDKHTERILDIVRNQLPSGSGIDNGTQIDLDKSTPAKIVFHVNYHHMNETGYYDGWTAHTITVTPSFVWFDLKISGRDRNQIKDYLGDTYHFALAEPVKSAEPEPAAAV